MKTKKMIALSSGMAMAVLSVYAQGTFINLDFESANLSPVPPNQAFVFVPISSALPGWSGAIGNDPVTQVQQNSSDTGQASIDIFGPNYPSIAQEPPFGQGTIDGNYTVYLQSGGSLTTAMPANTSIWQTGTIPANAQSIEFKAWSFGQNSIFSVSFAGNILSPVVLSSVQNPSGIPVSLYGANIAPYAGQTGQLEFTSVFSQSGASWTELDDISFSPTAVPEPSPLVLTGVGALLFALYRRLAHR